MTLDAALHYIGLGWGLCSIPRGTKGPTADGWNTAAHWLTTEAQVRAVAERHPANGWGLVHAPSNTCCIDVDHAEHFRTCLAEYGLDPDTLFAGAPRIIGRDGRDKALFSVPEGVTLKTHKLVWPPRAPGEKPTTIFELRAGAVQDVLPPTIHPDTGQPYRWRDGEPQCAPPVLPPELQAMWQAWDDFKPQMQAICPWAPKPAAPKPRTRSARQHDNVIGQFNQAHDVAMMLKAHGYKQRGKRWLSPTSSSNLAGVVIFEDGTHCYSHHASDPLNDGHAHDAFSLFTLLDHGGDMTAAVAAAAQVLGLDTRPPDAVPMSNIKEFMARSAKAGKGAPAVPVAMDNMPPPELLTIPGVLGRVVDYANRTAPKPQPQFAVQAALALGAVVLGRNWCTTQDNYAAQYLVNVGKSASGKEHPRTVIDRILTEANLAHLLGPGGYTSDGAVFSNVLSKPTHLSIIDELGDLLGNAKAQGNFHKRQALTALVQAWGLLHGTLRPQGYSTMNLTARQREETEGRIVHRPSLTLLAMTTPGTFYGALTEQAIEGGLLNRLILVESHLPPRVRGRAERLPVPQAVLDWLAAVTAQVGEGNLVGQLAESPDMIPDPRLVDFTDEALAMFGQYEAECIEDIKALEGEGLAELQGRSCEKAMRLALVVAVSVNVAAPAITGAVAHWAIRYVRYYTEQTLLAVREHMHGTQFAQQRADVLVAIRKGGARGRTEFELARSCRPFAGLEPRARRSVLDSLKADRLAEFVDMGKGPGGRGKSRTAWVALNPDTDEDVEDAA